MPDYLLTLLEDENAHASQTPIAMARIIHERAAFTEALRQRGVLREGGRFRPSAEGRRVRRRDGQLRVEAGPFAEGGRALGGYYRVQAEKLEEAVTIGAACPRLPSDQVEVRPTMKGGIDSDKESRAGKIFGFAVLGEAVLESEWVVVMDRIDAETSGCFPPDSFLGGVRLQPPKSGRHVGHRGEAMLDGPFLESKEVIGGLFFMRMLSLDEAIRWAAESRFVVHGTLEVRELWRS